MGRCGRRVDVDGAARGSAAFWREIEAGARARRRPRRRGCRRRLAADGFETLAGCRLSRWPRCRGVTCGLLSGKSHDLHARRGGVREIARRLGRSASTISREMRRNASTRTYAWSIGRRRRSGMKSDERAARRWRSSPRMTGCVSMWRSDWPGRSRDLTEIRCAGRRCVSSVVDMVVERTGVGRMVETGADRQRLRLEVRDDASMRISHEVIYQALYVQGRGALKRELMACCVPAARCGCARSNARTGQEIRESGDDDQRAAGRSRRPGGERRLGRRMI